MAGTIKVGDKFEDFNIREKFNYSKQSFDIDGFGCYTMATPGESNANCFESCILGDLNGDGGYNVLDIVILANCVLAENCADLENGCAGDLNGDGEYNILDVVILANIILT